MSAQGEIIVCMTETDNDVGLSPEQAFGTAATLLLMRNQIAAAALLAQVDRNVWSYEREDWGINYYDVLLVVPIETMDTYDEEVRDLILSTLNEVLEGYRERITSLRVGPLAVGGEWRARVLAAIQGQVSNHATLVPLRPSHPAFDQLNFRDMAELTVYKELRTVQERLPETSTLTIIPNCALRVPKHTWEPDFVVIYRGKAGVIEVDGASHNAKRASDKSRERLLENAGFTYVDRFDAADCEDSATVAQLVSRFLEKLTAA
jgi:hypothetical protein